MLYYIPKDSLTDPPIQGLEFYPFNPHLSPEWDD